MTTALADALDAYRSQLSPDQPAAGHRSPRRRAWLVVVLAAAVLAGGALTMLRPGGAPDPGPPAPVVGAPSPAPTTGSAPTAAPAPATGAALSVPPPAGWRLWTAPVLRTWLPSIPAAGPTDPDRVAGFTRTPPGALAAAASLHPLIYYTRDRAAWARLADERVVWADGQREALAAALDPVWDVVDPAGPAQMTPLGYRLIAYGPDRAQFRLWWAVEYPDARAATVGALVDVVWVDGDWSLFFDEPAMDLRGLQSQDSFLAWGPT